jgi:hypothetical protein
MIGLQRIKLAFGTDDQSRKIFPQKSACRKFHHICNDKRACVQRTITVYPVGQKRASGKLTRLSQALVGAHGCSAPSLAETMAEPIWGSSGIHRPLVTSDLAVTTE